MDWLVLGFALLLALSIRRRPGRGSELRGILALLVLFHHLSLFVPGGFLLPLFREWGKPAVAAFLFLSGMGLMRRYRSDPDYLHSFLRRRMTKLWIPYAAVAILSFFARPLWTGSRFGVSDLLNAWRYGDPIVSNGWYVFFLAALYLLFWLTAKTLRRPGRIVAVIGAAVLLWIPACHLLGWGDYWCASGPAFALGLAWGAWGVPIPRKLHWNSPILAFLGDISYELYLIHGLLLLLLRQQLSGPPLAVFVLILSVAAAAILHHGIGNRRAGNG